MDEQHRCFFNHMHVGMLAVDEKEERYELMCSEKWRKTDLALSPHLPLEVGVGCIL